MSQAAFERLEASSEALIGALDAGRIDELETAVSNYRSAFDAVRDTVKDDDGQRLRARATHMLRLAEAAQMRVNFLTDQNARRLAAVQAARGEPVVATYQRQR